MPKKAVILGLAYILINIAGCTTQALYDAAIQGIVEKAKRLLKEGVDPYSSTDRYYNITPMSAAIYNGNKEIVELFVKRSTQRQKEMALSSAARQGDFDIVEMILSYGINANSRDFYGTAALESAARATRFHYSFGHTSSQPAKTGYMALPSGGAVSMTMPCERPKDVLNLSLIRNQSTGQFAETVKLLLENGADVNIKSTFETTPLHKAVKYLSRRAIDGYSEEAKNIVKMLLDYGADVNAKTDTSDTPLHYAVWFDEVSFIKSEVRLGIDVRLTGFGNDTEISRNQSDIKYQRFISLDIVDPSQKEIVALLLNNGANINAINNEGNTPLHEASDNGLLDVVEFLLEKGAKPNLQNNNGEKPLDLANRRGHYEIVKILENYTRNN